MVNFNATLIAQDPELFEFSFYSCEFAYKPLMKIMDDRKNKIAGDLALLKLLKLMLKALKQNMLLN